LNLIHRDDVDPQTRAWWDAFSLETTRAMQDHCMRYITPISYSTSDNEGRLEGTGAYIEYRRKRLLITNEHVIRDWRKRQFGHQLLGCNDVFRLSKPTALEGYPVDAAICMIDDKVWNSQPHAAEPVPLSRIATKHQPAPGELFFLSGFPGERSGFVFETLISHATRLVTQELPPGMMIPGLHPNYFTLNYPVGKAQSVDPNNTIPLSLPPGLSGSLVWNTRRVECHAQGKEWRPELAQVTGLLCTWIQNPPYVVALRSEMMLDFLRRRAARPYWWGRMNAAISRYIRKFHAHTQRILRRERSPGTD
jgi:hypothetical protein